MSDNKALWGRAFTTDPRAVKPITGKQYKGNSPNPYWIVERLTDEFGPCGMGWGFNIMSERFERFGEGTTAEALHIAVLRFWFRQGAERGEFEQVGQTRASYTSAGGKFIVDEDAPKKSVTDALVKCASYLGFAGDIFSGMWDDSKYVQWAGNEWDRRYQEKQTEPETQRMSPEKLADWQAAISGAADDELAPVFAEATKACEALKDRDAYKAIRAIYLKHPAALPSKKAAA